ncbi:DUF6949 family protein [Zhengella mangrovi]|uniref:DUF6949 family protein n=1 Tax=Zhengella mangrovi TaxID=1982044 RepID=UPI001054C78B|nr:hypothetical protein [Zhengella mangrovi]
MSSVQLILFAYLTGLTVTGCVAATAEALVSRPVTFLPPFVSTARLLRSMVFTAFAGPAMMLNDAMDARRDAAISRSALAGVFVVVNVWVVALGVVSLALLSAVFDGAA